MTKKQKDYLMANTAVLAKLDEMEKRYVTMKNRMTTFRGKAKVADHATRSFEVIAGGALAGAAGYFEGA